MSYKFIYMPIYVNVHFLKINKNTNYNFNSNHLTSLDKIEISGDSKLQLSLVSISYFYCCYFVLYL